MTVRPIAIRRVERALWLGCCGTLLAARPAMSATVGGKTPPGPPWEVSIGGSTRFGNGSDASGGTLPVRNDLLAGIAHHREGPRLSLTFSGDAAALVDPIHARLENVDYTFATSGTYALSQRLALTFTSDLTSTLAQDAPSLGPEAARVENGTMTSSSSEARIAYLRSEDTTFDTGLKADLSGFDAPGLVGGWALAADAEVNHAWGPRDAGLVNFAIGHARVGELDVQALRAHAEWSRAWRDGLHTRLLAGHDLSGRSGEWLGSFVGGASLDTRLGAGDLNLSIARATGVGFGLGRARVTGDLSARYTRPFGRRLSLNTHLAARQSGDPWDEAFRVDSLSAGSGLTCVLNSKFEIGAAYQARTGSEASPSGGVQVRPEHRVGVDFSYREKKQWRF